MKKSESMRNMKTRQSLMSGKLPYKNPFIIESAITGKKGVKIKNEDTEEAKEGLKRQNNIGTKSYQSLEPVRTIEEEDGKFYSYQGKTKVLRF